ncbi:hypothetical protein OZX60_06900 [Streptococcaceae bacterium ESL0687]|nr:hypothetical protein OZX60_06900 [Streptococcaceae bacterium ESL0687]
MLTFLSNLGGWGVFWLILDVFLICLVTRMGIIKRNLGTSFHDQLKMFFQKKK